MESEKVKEIKKALKDNANYEHHDKLGYIDGYKCKTVAYADILTLITELEKENVILQGTKDRLTFADKIKLVDNAVEIKLKQFAERLKDRLRFTSPTSDVLKIENLIFDGIEVKEAIDETLKECLND